MPRRRFARAAAVLAAAALGVSALSACTPASPIKTKKPYAASDGVRAQFDSTLRAENLMLLTKEKGAPAQLYGALVNNSTEPATFIVAVEGTDPVQVKVPGNSTVHLPQEGATPVSGEFTPGGTVPASASTDRGGSVSLHVPVLDGTIPPYDEVLPTATPSS
ncbi:MAG: hypothetical protein Q4B12_01380 [Bowdeniella nasicola]|nr:hypothetical protein [Bowdeniella nasicola]